MKIRFLASLFFVAVSFSTSLLITGCEVSDPIGRLREFSGDVTFRPEKTSPFSPAVSNAVLFPSSGIRTSAGASAHITFLDHTEILILANADIDLEERIPEIFHGRGSALYKVKKLRKGMKIKTPQVITSILGTTLMVSVASGVTTVSVDEGNVEVTLAKGGKSIAVSTGQELTASTEGVVSHRNLSPFERERLQNPSGKVNLQRR